MSLTLSLVMLAQQSQTQRGADGSVMQIVDLNAQYDPERYFDGAARIRFAHEDALGQLRPGNLYEVTLVDLGPAPVQHVEAPSVDQAAVATELAAEPAPEAPVETESPDTTPAAPEAPAEAAPLAPGQVPEQGAPGTTGS